MKMIRNCDLDKKVSVKVILKHLYPYYWDAGNDEVDLLVSKMLDEEWENDTQ